MTQNQDRCHIAVTIGDPAGIGPEVVLKALANPKLHEQCEITVVGSAQRLRSCWTHLCQQLGDSNLLADLTQIRLIDVELDQEIERQVQIGQGNAASGTTSFAYLKRAIAEAVAGKVQGIVTAPISKAAWKAAGHLYPGQTELLAEGSGTQQFGMMFVGRSPHTGWILRTILATTHIPLRQVPDLLSPELLSQKLELLIHSLRQDFGLDAPRIAVSGLNPHSGEQGQLGREEQDWLIPWLDQARRTYPDLILDGPVPPDTLWVKPGNAWFGLPSAAASPPHDAYLALYHDQGLIPVKLMAFDTAVNTTIGLPFVRTSPDHGTAFDIAGQGIAQASSMAAALDWAIAIAQQRQTTLASS